MYRKHGKKEYRGCVWIVAASSIDPCIETIWRRPGITQTSMLQGCYGCNHDVNDRVCHPQLYTCSTYGLPCLSLCKQLSQFYSKKKSEFQRNPLQAKQISSALSDHFFSKSCSNDHNIFGCSTLDWVKNIKVNDGRWLGRCAERNHTFYMTDKVFWES